jgi:endo-1,4-beta-xylanase
VMRTGFLTLFFCFLLCAPVASGAERLPASDVTLRQLADRIGFKIGAALVPRLFAQDPQYREVLAREFNATELTLVMRIAEPQRDQFNLNMMDRITQYARENHLALFGGPLIYHTRSTPDWVENRQWSESELDSITRNYIDTMIKRGGDTYFAWEVVNEPLTTPNPPWGRVWSNEDYIARAFRYARAANPNAVLVLDQSFGRSGVESSIEGPFFDLLKKAKAKGAPIDAVGIEMHMEMQTLRPTYLDEFRNFLKRAQDAGVDVLVTEMDAYQGPPGAIADPFQRQKQVYHDVLAACLASPVCKAFFTWGLTDKVNMYNMRPRDPRPDAAPLPFDDNYQKKPAYYGMLEALQEKAGH